MVDGYEFIKELGSGGFGSVHLAIDQATRNEVAVKLLTNKDSLALDRFRREGRILHTEINNRYVVDLLGYDLECEPPFLVLEYCKHGSLRDWVKNRRPWDHVAMALAHVVQGLHGIHQMGGFHRDLKPDNLLIQEDPTGGLIIKVADFGLARIPITENTPMTRTAWGTEGYFAPEILIGYDYTPKADIFSLGITGVELLTGDRKVETLKSADCPNDLKLLLTKMVAIDPENRPNIRGVSQALEQVLKDRQKPTTASSNWKLELSDLLIGGLLFGGVLLALSALAKGDEKEWENNVRE